MGPFGSDQSRHVDDFGTKKHNFNDFGPHLDDIFREEMKVLTILCNQVHLSNPTPTHPPPTPTPPPSQPWGGGAGVGGGAGRGYTAPTASRT